MAPLLAFSQSEIHGMVSVGHLIKNVTECGGLIQVERRGEL